MKRLFIVSIPLALVLSLGWAARADTSVDAAQASSAAIVEQLRLFDELCLRIFPNDIALDAATKDKAMVAMSAQDVQKFLHADPGNGWYYKLSGTTYLYAITVQAPPYHACAIRRLYAADPQFAEAYQATLQAWVAANAGAQLGPEQEQTTERDGQTIHATQQPLNRDGKIAEMFLSLASKLPNGLVELRFVRRVPTVQ